MDSYCKVLPFQMNSNSHKMTIFKYLHKGHGIELTYVCVYIYIYYILEKLMIN